MSGGRWGKRRSLPTSQRKRLFGAQPLCEECSRRGRISAAAEIDHRVPLRHGGADDESNFQLLCRECHRRKTITERGATYKPLCSASGEPLDDEHPWHEGGAS